jgi:hypothetical protein
LWEEKNEQKNGNSIRESKFSNMGNGQPSVYLGIKLYISPHHMQNLGRKLKRNDAPYQSTPPIYSVWVVPF